MLFGPMSKDWNTQLLHLTHEVQLALDGMFEVPGAPEPGSGLDQEGLRNGEEIVQDLVKHGEPGVALEHLLYMVKEPPVPLSASARAVLESLCDAFGFSDKIEWLE